MLLGCTDFGDCSKLLLTQFLYLSPSPANDKLHVIDFIKFITKSNSDLNNYYISKPAVTVVRTPNFWAFQRLTINLKNVH